MRFVITRPLTGLGSLCFLRAPSALTSDEALARVELHPAASGAIGRPARPGAGSIHRELIVFSHRTGSKIVEVVHCRRFPFFCFLRFFFLSSARNLGDIALVGCGDWAEPSPRILAMSSSISICSAGVKRDASYRPLLRGAAGLLLLAAVGFGAATG